MVEAGSSPRPPPMSLPTSPARGRTKGRASEASTHRSGKARQRRRRGGAAHRAARRCSVAFLGGHDHRFGRAEHRPVRVERPDRDDRRARWTRPIAVSNPARAAVARRPRARPRSPRRARPSGPPRWRRSSWRGPSGSAGSRPRRRPVRRPADRSTGSGCRGTTATPAGNDASNRSVPSAANSLK